MQDRNAAGSGYCCCLNGSRATALRLKMGVDATRKWPSEGFTRPWPDEIKMDRETKKKVDALWPKLGL